MSQYCDRRSGAPKRMFDARISVVIPAYNAAGFLPRCLDSVFAQTVRPQEVIVVDDGSTDNTAAVARRLGAKVVRRPNGGLAAARNTGIAHASSEWIALLDADDLWSPQKLEWQTSCIGAETILVYTGVRFFDRSGTLEDRPAISAAAASKILRYCNPIAPSSVLVRRQSVMHGGGFREDLRACEDWEMWVRIQGLGQFVAVRAPLTHYYVHPGSMSANPERMLHALDQILDSTLVAELRGVERWTWKRRIRAAQLCSAGLIARDNRLKGELHYMLRSLSSWPSPFWQPQRFVMFAVSARNRLRRSEGGL